MKAVIWTDMFQGAIMMIGLSAISIIGVNEAGSMKKVFEIFKERERMTLEWVGYCTKIEVFLKDYFSKCHQVRIRIWPRLLMTSLIESFIFCVVRFN